MEFRFVGRAHKTRSQNVSNQRCVNWVPEASQGDSKVPVALYPAPGTVIYLQLPISFYPIIYRIDPSIGPYIGGNTITIYGKNFFTGIVVKVNGTTVNPGDVTLIDSGTLMVIMPSLGVQGVVNIFLFNGDKSSSAVAYTYQPPIVPTVTGITPDNGDANGGALITLTGTGFIHGFTTIVLQEINSSQIINVTNPTVAVGGASLTFILPEDTIFGGENINANTLKFVVSVTVNAISSLTYQLFQYTCLQQTTNPPIPDNGPKVGGTFVSMTGTNFYRYQTWIRLDSKFYFPPNHPIPGQGTVNVTNSTSLTFTTLPATTISPNPIVAQIRVENVSKSSFPANWETFTYT